MKKFIVPYLMYMTIFHVLYWVCIVGLHNLPTLLELARAVLSDGLLYMMIIFLPIASSGLSSFKVLLFSMPVIVVSVGFKYAVSASVLGYEQYSYSLENMKMISETVVSLTIHIVLAAIAFNLVNRHEPQFRFFSLQKQKIAE